MNTVLGVPSRKIVNLALDAVAAVVNAFQKFSVTLQTLVFAKLGYDFHSRVGGIRADTEQILNVKIGYRKSEGQFVIALRFVYD